MRGTEIHTWAERRVGDQYVAMPIHPFDSQDYGVSAFLAGIRNYSAILPIAEGRGLPDDASETVLHLRNARHPDAHSVSWVSVEELAAYPYDTVFKDRRGLKQVGFTQTTVTLPEGEETTVRDFLGPGYFADLNDLIERKADRVVLWFRG